MKQLGRLDEDQALDAIANYRDAASRRGGKSILNPSAYFMVILREFIEVRTLPVHQQRLTSSLVLACKRCTSMPEHLNTLKGLALLLSLHARLVPHCADLRAALALSCTS